MKLLLTTVALLGMSTSTAYADENAAPAPANYDSDTTPSIAQNTCDPAVLVVAGVGAAAKCVYGMFSMPVESAAAGNSIDQRNGPPSRNQAPPGVDAYLP